MASDDFVARLREGGAMDSAGEFTLDPRRALEMLATFRFPFEGAWLLRLIQSAVVSGPQKGIEVVLTSNSLRLSFEPHCAWASREILEAFPDPHRSKSLWVQYLKEGLWPVALGMQRRVKIGLESEARELLWEGGSWGSREIQGVRGVVLEVSPLPTREQRLLEKTLTSRAFVCPRPLTLNGRRIDGLERAESDREGYDGFWRWTHALPGEGRRMGIPGGGRSPFDSGGLKEAEILLVLEEMVEPESSPPAASSCYFVCDGVVSERIFFKLENKFKIDLFVSAEGLATDLGGFSLRQEAVELRLRELEQLLRPVLNSELVERLYPYQENEAESLRWQGTAALVMGLGLGLLTWTPLLGLAGAMAGFWGARSAEERAERSRLQKAQALKLFLPEFLRIVGAARFRAAG